MGRQGGEGREGGGIRVGKKGKGGRGLRGSIRSGSQGNTRCQNSPAGWFATIVACA